MLNRVNRRVNAIDPAALQITSLCVQQLQCVISRSTQKLDF